MTDLLYFAEHRLQEGALLFMAIVYALRIRWLLRFKAGKERQPPTGSPATSRRKGILYSWAIIGMPWTMESTRRQWLIYVQFVIFHLGVVAAIALSFVIPYAPDLLVPEVVQALQVSMGAAFVVGCLRLYRRLSSRHLRAISTPDDYFSLLLLTVWFLSATLAAPNRPEQDAGVLLAYFVMTAFFLVYVPFSKISHYLYYPFTRFYFGRSMGHRGVFPLPRSAQAERVTGNEPARSKVTASA